MSAVQHLAGNGVGAFFAAVGALSVAIAQVSGLSIRGSAVLVAAVELWTATCWILFAPSARDIWQLPRVVLTLNVALLRATAAYVLRGCRPTFPEWTFKFEIVRAALRALRGGFAANNIVRSPNARYFNSQVEWVGNRMGPKSCAAHGTRMEVVMFNGLEHVWIRDHDRNYVNSTEKQRFVVLYYHGGGFVLFSPHFFVGLGNRVRSAALKIIREKHPELRNVSIECFLANYRKSPDHKYPIPQEDALAAFEHVVLTEKLDPCRIVLMGDSAGGGLCASTLLRLKAKGSKLPGGAMLSCPFVDLAVDESLDDTNCMFAIELGYAMAKAFHPTPQDQTTWKEAAAVYCDLSGLPPALIQVGTADTIYSGSIKFYDKAQADGLGSTWELDVFTHMPHAFTVFSGSLLPDADRGLDRIADFAVRQFVRNL